MNPAQDGDTPATDATMLLGRLRSGDESAAQALLPLVYEELRATAGSFFRQQRADHTLQPTALVHEAYLKLVRGIENDWESRGHFCAVASKAMRQILSDHARAKMTAKRRADGSRQPLTTIESPSKAEAVELIALDEALTELAEAQPRGAEIIEMRFFGGLSTEEIASILGVTRRTVEREWRRCQAWLEVRVAAGSG